VVLQRVLPYPSSLLTNPTPSIQHIIPLCWEPISQIAPKPHLTSPHLARTPHFFTGSCLLFTTTLCLPLLPPLGQIIPPPPARSTELRFGVSGCCNAGAQQHAKDTNAVAVSRSQSQSRTIIHRKYTKVQNCFQQRNMFLICVFR
jgi:hypothetical protein